MFGESGRLSFVVGGFEDGDAVGIVERGVMVDETVVGFAVFAGRDAEGLFKFIIELIGVGKADAGGDFVDGNVGVGQQFGCLLHTQGVDRFQNGVAGIFFVLAV